MKPSRSNINKNTCNPISSNCVDWEGGDLDGIKLCPGDTVSEVIHKVNTVVEALKAELNLTNLQIDCLLSSCQACPQPEKTLHNILTLLINKVCTEITPTTPITSELVLNIAECYRFESGGDIVTTLKHSDYTIAIGLKTCQMLTSIINITNSVIGLESTINNIQQQIALLLNKTISVNSICVLPGEQRIEDAFEAFEAQYCALKTILGSNSDLTKSIGQDVKGLTPDVLPLKLIDPTQTLFPIAASNIGLLLQHYGIAINDLRAAVKAIQDNCCSITCDDIIVDFDVKLSDDRSQITLFFANKSKIPIGFTDCNATDGNRFTITDSSGATYTGFVKTAQEVNNPNGITFDLSGSAIDTSSDYIFSMDACMGSASFNCVKCVTKTITYKNTCGYCEYTATGTDLSAYVIIHYKEDSVVKAAILKAGEKVVLAKSVKITSLSYVGTITISSTCSNLSDIPVETLDCYAWIFGTGDDGATEAYQDVYIKGIKVDNIDYLFSSELSINSGSTVWTNSLQAKIEGNSTLKNLFLNICAARYDIGGSGQGANHIISFRAAPTIGTNSYLICEATIATGGPYRFKSLLVSYLRSALNAISDDNLRTTCTCSGIIG